MKLYNIIVEEQNNKNFRSISVLFKIKEKEKNNEIYLPYFVAEKLNKEYSTVKKVEIELERETFRGFKEFIKDFINESRVLKIKTIMDIDKYRISKIIKKDFYEITYSDEKECEKIVKVILNENDDLKGELLPKILDDSKSELLYKLKSEFVNFPDEILYNRSLMISPNVFYKIEYLRLFDYLIYVHKSYKGEWYHQYYAYTKIEKNNEKGKWIVAIPLLNHHFHLIL